MIAILLLSFGLLAAEITYWPTTSIAEDFGATWCGGCPFAWEGLQVLHGYTHNGELISAKLYTESAELSSPEIQQRFDYYEVIGIPAVIFNGKIRIDGSGDGIADGSLYGAALNQFRYTSSPIKMNIGSFSATGGTLSGTIEMVSPTESISNANIVYYLLENSVGSETHVVRSVLYDNNFALSGAGNTHNYNKTFALNTAWNTANLWAIAAVQLENKAIVQSVSTLPLPANNLRAAMNWNPWMEGPANYSHNSQTFWLYNFGAPDNYTTHIAVDYAPADWYFNYCDEEGNCYPGHLETPVSLGTGDTKDFHLNIWIGSPGYAYFRFVISSPNLGEYSIPFHYQVEGTSVSDPTLSPAAFRISGLYPNPVSKAAVFTVLSGKNTPEATIDVFNLKGQKVQCLDAKNLQGGENMISFTPESTLPNGIYFYRLQGSSAKAGKFILVK